MNLQYSSKTFSQLTHNELNKKNAIHEAGHALAIYLGSRQNQFPPFFFQLYIKAHRCHFQLPRSLNSLFHAQCMAKTENNHLIQALPFPAEKAIKAICPEQLHTSESSFEAEAISLLVGPLAEAKYVAMRDGERINPHLVNLNALNNYGGSADLEIIHEYLEWYMTEEVEREKKISEYFLRAFNFINDRSNWLAITVLATYILAGHINIIEGEEVMPNLMPSLVKT